nr:head GIN domain-containing protein [Polymorphobacter sp.]
MTMRMMLLAAAAIAGPAAASERSFAVEGFDGISVSSRADVSVSTGKPASVQASGPDSALDRLEIKVEAGTLKIRTKSGTDWGWGGENVRILVTVPMLRSAGVTGSGDVSIDRVAVPEFTAGVSGSGNLRLASLIADTARFSVAGSGSVAAAGTSAAVKASVAGSGDLDLSGLKAQTLSASVAGSGDVDAHASITASISVAGSGDVRVRGGAKCSVSKSGSGAVDCGDFSVR